MTFQASGGGAHLSEGLQTVKYIYTIYTEQRRAVEDVLASNFISAT